MSAAVEVVKGYVATSVDLFKHGHVLTALSPFRAFQACIFLVSYVLIQRLIVHTFFKPRPPRKDGPLPKPHGRIAVVGAGLTGVSSAAHCIAHNFEVVIFEAKDSVGGIWADVNSTSSLQLNSLIYRFHPAVLWKHTYPARDEIVSEITRIWKEYKLEKRTKFNTAVKSARRANGTSSPGAKWIINDGTDGEFDAIIVTVGTCGKPKMADFPGMPHTHWDDEKEENQEKDGRGHRSTAQMSYQPRSNPTNRPKGSDSREKAAEKQRKEEEARRLKQQNDAAKRRAYRDMDEIEFPVLNPEAPADPRGSGAPSFAEVATHPPAEDSAAINSEPEGTKDADEVSESGLWEDAEDDGTVKEQGSEPGDHDHQQQDKQQQDNEEEEKFRGEVLHSSELDDAELDGKTVVIIGSGASGVEAAETALAQGAEKAVVIARDDKWIIPRNTFIDTIISSQPFGQEMPLSFVWEWFIRTFHYRDLKDLSPKNLGIYEGTPVVNNAFLEHIRAGKIKYVRGDTERLVENGVRVKTRTRDQPKGAEDAKPETIEGDIVVLATGFERPTLDFLPEDVFPDGYSRPDLYLQNFATEDWSVLCTNSSYMNAIGTVGHIHIGIYTRILLLFLLDPSARPDTRDMKLWVDVVRFVKRGAKGGALGFFTYMELVIWFLTFHVFRPDRLRWIFFTMQGWGVPVKY
ncbi:hypothetical protein PENSPDRAFT_734118 [Peniophora sp. CONT]|nr:hypothetical protein PENSPDRAFT_734118 [Peniophora sp. CONT]